MMKSFIEHLSPSPRLTVLATLCTLTMWLGQGCAMVDNDRLTIGGDPVSALATEPSPDRVVRATEPSLASGSRDHWASETIIVPVDGTRHHPHYTLAQPNYSRSVRSHGAFPSQDSSLTLGSDAGPQVWEWIASPFHGAMDVVLFLPRAIMSPPWADVSSPVDSIERYRDGDAGSPGLEPEESPITRATADDSP